MNTLADGPERRTEVAPREDLELAPMLYALDRFIPIVEFGYAAEWSVAEWQPVADPSHGPTYEPRVPGGYEPKASPSWPEAVRSLMSFDVPSSGWLAAFLGELLRLPALALAWVVGGCVAGADIVIAIVAGVSVVDTFPGSLDQLRDAPVEAVVGLDPENTLRWLGAIYHGLGWALISMAIVTFTGVMRRD